MFADFAKCDLVDHVNLANIVATSNMVPFNNYRIMEYAAVYGRLGLLKWCLDKEQGIPQSVVDNLFHVACIWGRLTMAKWIFKRYEIDLFNLRSDVYWSCTEYRHTNVLKWLIRHGVHVETISNYASRNGCTEILEWIEDNGYMSIDGKRFFTLACLDNLETSKWAWNRYDVPHWCTRTGLYYSISRNKPEIIRWLVGELHAPVNYYTLCRAWDNCRKDGCIDYDIVGFLAGYSSHWWPIRKWLYIRSKFSCYPIRAPAHPYMVGLFYGLYIAFNIYHMGPTLGLATSIVLPLMLLSMNSEHPNNDNKSVVMCWTMTIHSVMSAAIKNCSITEMIAYGIIGTFLTFKAGTYVIDKFFPRNVW